MRRLGVQGVALTLFRRTIVRIDRWDTVEEPKTEENQISGQRDRPRPRPTGRVEQSPRRQLVFVARKRSSEALTLCSDREERSAWTSARPFSAKHFATPLEPSDMFFSSAFFAPPGPLADSCLRKFRGSRGISVRSRLFAFLMIRGIAHRWIVKR